MEAAVRFTKSTTSLSESELAVAKDWCSNLLRKVNFDSEWDFEISLDLIAGEYNARPLPFDAFRDVWMRLPCPAHRQIVLVSGFEENHDSFVNAVALKLFPGKDAFLATVQAIATVPANMAPFEVVSRMRELLQRLERLRDRHSVKELFPSFAIISMVSGTLPPQYMAHWRSTSIDNHEEFFSSIELQHSFEKHMRRSAPKAAYPAEGSDSGEDGELDDDVAPASPEQSGYSPEFLCGCCGVRGHRVCRFREYKCNPQ